MQLKTIWTTLLVSLVLVSGTFAQDDHGHEHRKIDFPDVPGYLTLKCDFHIHTVFSDGNVWPSIRVEEALRDGLDAISITEHLEYQPHAQDIPHPDRNRSLAIAQSTAKGTDLMIVHGAEVTREMPPGHVNAIFIQDANKLMDEDPLKVFAEAKRQGAFIFWNHPNWIAQRKDGVAKLDKMHETLIAKGMLHGIEVVNETTYSDAALRIANEQNMTVMGTSDVHGLIDWDFDLEHGGHRPITLVMAKERTQESIKEALFAGRTVTWYNNLLIGKEAHLKPLVEASLSVESAELVETWAGVTQVVTLKVKNNSDADFLMENLSEYEFQTHADVVTFKAHSTTEISVQSLGKETGVDLRFKVLNAVMGAKQHPEVVISF